MIPTTHKLKHFSGHLTGLSSISRLWQFSEWYLSNGTRYKVAIITEKNIEIDTPQKSPKLLTVIKKISYLTGIVLVFSLIVKKHYRSDCIYTIWCKPHVYCTVDNRDTTDLLNELAHEAKLDSPNLHHAKQMFDDLCSLPYNDFATLNYAVDQLATCYFRYYPRIESPPILLRERKPSDEEEDNPSPLLDKDNPNDHYVFEVWRKLVSVKSKN